MAKKLEDAVEAVLLLISQIDGLRQVTNPQERFNVDPFAVAYPGPCTLAIGSSQMVKGLPHIIVEIHKVRKDMARDLATVIPYLEEFKELLKVDANRTLPDSAGNATVDSIVSVSCEFGPSAWGEKPTIGWKFDIEVKIW